MSSIAHQENKKFEHFSECPPEIQMMMVDEMEVEDRCRFRRCSTTSNKEATNSKKFRNSVEINAEKETYLTILVKYGNLEGDHGFRWVFERDYKTGKNCMRYESYRDISYRELDDSTEMHLLALTTLKKIIKSHENRMEELKIDGLFFIGDWKNVDFGFENLNSLKSLELRCLGVSQFVSKVHGPLDELLVYGEGDTDILPDQKMTFQVRKQLYAPRLKLNKHQFLNLTASKIDIHIGHLTIDDICDFIKAWQNGSIRENFESCSWHFGEPDGCFIKTSDKEHTFMTEFFARFGLEYEYRPLVRHSCPQFVEIEQIGNDAKKATISEARDITFKVNVDANKK